MRTVPSIWKKGRPTLVCQFWGDCTTHASQRVSNGALMVQDAGIWRVHSVGVQAHLEDEVVERVADLPGAFRVRHVRHGHGHGMHGMQQVRVRLNSRVLAGVGVCAWQKRRGVREVGFGKWGAVERVQKMRQRWRSHPGSGLRTAKGNGANVRGA